jgi:hypothetical protein
MSVTFLTKPESETTLKKYHDLVQPGGPGWKKFDQRINNKLTLRLTLWVISTICIYMLLFGLYQVILYPEKFGVLYIIAGIAGFSWIIYRIRNDFSIAKNK